MDARRTAGRVYRVGPVLASDLGAPLPENATHPSMLATFMKSRCPLCHRSVPSDARHWCRCGKAMDSRCYDVHGDWCAADGSDARIGALER